MEAVTARTAARLRAWWPDVYLALIVLTFALLGLWSPRQVLCPTGAGGVMHLPGVIAWATLIALCCIGLIAFVMRRYYVLAAACSLGLSFLIALNAAVTIPVNGLGATGAAAMYAATALAFYDRYTRLRVPVPLPPTVLERQKGRS